MATLQVWLLGLTALAATASAVGIFLGVRSTKHIFRQKATLSFMESYNTEPLVSEGHSIVRTIRTNDNEQAEKILGDKTSRASFLFLMTKFETLAIALKHNIYDETMVTDYLGREMRQAYKKSSSIINYIRENEGNDRAFKEFEELAQKIKDKGIHIK